MFGSSQWIKKGKVNEWSWIALPIWFSFENEIKIIWLFLISILYNFTKAKYIMFVPI